MRVILEINLRKLLSSFSNLFPLHSFFFFKCRNYFTCHCDKFTIHTYTFDDCFTLPHILIVWMDFGVSILFFFYLLDILEQKWYPQEVQVGFTSFFAQSLCRWHNRNWNRAVVSLFYILISESTPYISVKVGLVGFALKCVWQI